MGNAHPFHGFLNFAFVFGFGQAQEIQVAVAPLHHHVVHRHGKLPIHFLALWHIGHQVALERLRHGQAAQADAARFRLNLPHQAFKQGRFAAAVYAHQRAGGAALQREAHVADGRVAVAVANRYRFNADGGGLFRHYFPNPLTMVETVVLSRSR